jgi:hypothetical protein
MQNTYPFNMQEHVFDFKVKVNFQNGNVSLTAPQIVTPPAIFQNSINHQYQPAKNNPIFANTISSDNSFVPYNPYTQYVQPMMTAPNHNSSNTF